LSFLFVFWDAAGAVPVELRLVKALLAHGHEVAVLGPASIEALVLAAGAAFLIEPSMTPYDSIVEPPEDEMIWLHEHVWFGPAVAQARRVTEAIGSLRPDVVVSDDTIWGAMVAAEASGLPSAALHSTLYGRIRDHAPDDRVRAFWEAGLEPLNEARHEHGLGPLDSVFEQEAQLDKLLILTAKEFADPDEVLPGNAVFIGPPLDAAARLAEVDSSEPLVLMSLSTSNMKQAGVMQRMIDAVGRLPVRGVATLGPALAGMQFEVPPNVTVFDEKPHSELLPGAGAVVTHAGHGTVMAALAHGVPLVCMPMGRDQPGVTRRVVACGAGVEADAEADPDQIADAVRTVLADPSYRESAMRLAEAIDATVTAQSGVRELEALAGA
jgi:MGT family glycosyltransferase